MQTKEEKRLYWNNNKENINRRRRERYKNDLEYKKNYNDRRKERRQNDPIWKEKQNERTRLISRYIKIKCLDHYSKNDNYICSCCDENNIDLLTIDHIGGGGSEHRTQLKLNKEGIIYRYLIKNGFPDGYQVLCFNCNCGKRTEKTCPHIWDKEKVDQKLSNIHYKYYRIPILKKFSKNDNIKCVNCDETNIFFLTIDHINGGGKKHIKSFKSYGKYEKWLRNEALESDYQILCNNCNYLKSKKK